MKQLLSTLTLIFFRYSRILFFVGFACVHGNVYISYIGQLGNQMFQYAIGYAVSKETGTKLYAPYGQINEIFNIDYVTPPFTSTNDTFTCIKNTVVDLDNQKFDPSVFSINKDTLLHGFFQTDRYFIKYRNDLLKLFSFRSDHINQEALDFINSFNKCFVCMHLRAGDYFNSTFPVMDDSYFIRAIDLTLKKLEKSLSECVFAITSNDEDGRYLNLLMNKIHTSYPGINLIHYKKDQNSEFALMQQADACIISASSFSWWAAWLNTNCKLIILPKYWFNYYKYHDTTGTWSPENIVMSLPNQYFVAAEQGSNGLMGEYNRLMKRSRRRVKH